MTACDDFDGALLFTGYNEAIIGTALVWSNIDQVTRVIYSGTKIVEMLMRDSSLTEEDAVEHISFNMEGAYVGPRTPIVCWPGFDKPVEKNRVKRILRDEVLKGRKPGA